jgi:hypothetical protein
MSKDDLPTKLRAWLQKEGYPFELRAGREFQQSGWQVFHGTYYTDPETGKLREIDLDVSWGPYGGLDEKRGLVSFHLVCECKQSEKPWVVFTSRDADDSKHRLSGHLAPGPFGSRALDHGVTIMRDSLRALLPNTRIGHGVTKAFADSRTGDPTGPFAALAGVVTAAKAFSREHYATVFRDSTRGQINPLIWFGIHVPIVIFSGRLFEFYLDSAGNEIIEERERIHVLVRGGDPNDDSVLVQIVSARGLSDFTRDALHDARLVADAILDEAPTLWKSFRPELNFVFE